jgi:hypothetical protein
MFNGRIGRKGYGLFFLFVLLVLPFSTIFEVKATTNITEFSTNFEEGNLNKWSWLPQGYSAPTLNTTQFYSPTRSAYLANDADGMFSNQPFNVTPTGTIWVNSTLRYAKLKGVISCFVEAFTGSNSSSVTLIGLNGFGNGTIVPQFGCENGTSAYSKIIYYPLANNTWYLYSLKIKQASADFSGSESLYINNTLVLQVDRVENVIKQPSGFPDDFSSIVFFGSGLGNIFVDDVSITYIPNTIATTTPVSGSMYQSVQVMADVLGVIGLLYGVSFVNMLQTEGISSGMLKSMLAYIIAMVLIAFFAWFAFSLGH